MEEKEFEMAEQLANAQRDQMIAASREAMKPEKHNGFDGAHCVGCGNDMPAQRLVMGRVRCTDCQTVMERASKIRRH